MRVRVRVRARERWKERERCRSARERKADTGLFCLFGFFVLFRDYYFRFFFNRGNPRERKNGGGIYLQHTHERAGSRCDFRSIPFLHFFFSFLFAAPRAFSGSLSSADLCSLFRYLSGLSRRRPGPSSLSPVELNSYRMVKEKNEDEEEERI